MSLGDLDICARCGIYRKHHATESKNHAFQPYNTMFSPSFTDKKTGKSYRFRLRDNPGVGLLPSELAGVRRRRRH